VEANDCAPLPHDKSRNRKEVAKMGTAGRSGRCEDRDDGFGKKARLSSPGVPCRSLAGDVVEGRGAVMTHATAVLPRTMAGLHALRRHASEYFAVWIVILDMKTAHPPVGAAYASGYARGRHAAKEQLPISQNPFRSDTAAFQGWNDGHYDERSARRVEIERHNAALWRAVGNN
jgi:hypothetical protein